MDLDLYAEIYAAPYISHYGTKGMKWGVRKGRSGKSIGVKSMSDEDLQAAVTRMNLERRYTKAVAESNQTAVSYGKKKVASIVEKSATVVVTAFVSKAMVAGVKKAVSVVRG